MRQFKLKVWDKVLRKMFKPQAISFDRKTAQPFAVSIPNKSWEPVTKFEILQWTGCCDEKGCDVYEADIVQIESDIYEVTWNQNDAVFELASSTNCSKRPIQDVQSGSIVGCILQ